MSGSLASFQFHTFLVVDSESSPKLKRSLKAYIKKSPKAYTFQGDSQQDMANKGVVNEQIQLEHS